MPYLLARTTKQCTIYLDRLHLRYTCPRIHFFAELGKVPRSCMVHYAVKQGCVRLRNALKCTSEAIFTVMKNMIAD